jgi:hypothetical protein
MSKQIRNNLITYSCLLLLAAVGIAYGQQIYSQYPSLRVWEFSNLVLMLVGVPMLFIQSRVGIPDFWSTDVSNQNRIGIPLMIGIGFGLLDVFVIKVMQHPHPYETLPPFLQPFPYSIFLYTSGAFEIEVFYRLIPITIILLLSSFWRGNQYGQAFFWSAAVLTSLREPLEQLPPAGWLFITYSLLTGFAMNFLQAVWFKRAGFLATLFIRLGHYLCWHIALGLYVELFELK